jgi:hypothetical protein
VRVDLDPAWIRMSMTLWRETTDMKVPMADQFKLHFIERRPAILSNFVRTSRAWAMLLSHCVTDGAGDRAELQALRGEVEAFNAWAKSEHRDLEVMGLKESIADNVDAMLADPELAPMIKKLLGPSASTE